jgi:hypothetical protein
MRYSLNLRNCVVYGRLRSNIISSKEQHQTQKVHGTGLSERVIIPYDFDEVSPYGISLTRIAWVCIPA